MMEIDQLVSLVTKLVKEKLEALESRKKVLVLENVESPCGNFLTSILESNGFEVSGIGAYKNGECLENYDFIVIPKERYRELLQQTELQEKTGVPQFCDEKEASRNFRIDKRIVTESDIHKLAREGFREIILSKKTIITPLALDAIKVSNIRVKKE